MTNELPQISKWIYGAVISARKSEKAFCFKQCVADREKSVTAAGAWPANTPRLLFNAFLHVFILSSAIDCCNFATVSIAEKTVTSHFDGTFGPIQTRVRDGVWKTGMMTLQIYFNCLFLSTYLVQKQGGNFLFSFCCLLLSASISGSLSHIVNIYYSHRGKRERERRFINSIPPEWETINALQQQQQHRESENIKLSLAIVVEKGAGLWGSRLPFGVQLFKQCSLVSRPTIWYRSVLEIILYPNWENKILCLFVFSYLHLKNKWSWPGGAPYSSFYWRRAECWPILTILLAIIAVDPLRDAATAGSTRAPFQSSGLFAIAINFATAPIPVIAVRIIGPSASGLKRPSRSSSNSVVEQPHKILTFWFVEIQLFVPLLTG